VTAYTSLIHSAHLALVLTVLTVKDLQECSKKPSIQNKEINK